MAGVALNMMTAAAAKTKAVAGVPDAGNAVGSASNGTSKLCTMDACAPRWDATSVEAYLCKQYSLAVFLAECNEQLQQARQAGNVNELVKQYATLYGGGDARLAVFVALASLNETELQLLQLRLVEDALAEVARHKRSGWSFSAASIRSRLWGGSAQTTQGPENTFSTGQDVLPAEEQIEEARASLIAQQTSPELYDDLESQQDPGSRLDARDTADNERARLSVRSEQLNTSTPLESPMAGLLKERCEIMRERLLGALGFMVLGSAELVDQEGMKRLRRIIRGLSALFSDNENAVTPQFYGYNTQSARQFALALCKPYLQELLEYYSPLGFA